MSKTEEIIYVLLYHLIIGIKRHYIYIYLPLNLSRRNGQIAGIKPGTFATKVVHLCTI